MTWSDGIERSEDYRDALHAAITDYFEERNETERVRLRTENLQMTEELNPLSIPLPTTHSGSTVTSGFLQAHPAPSYESIRQGFDNLTRFSLGGMPPITCFHRWKEPEVLDVGLSTKFMVQRCSNALCNKIEILSSFRESKRVKKAAAFVGAEPDDSCFL